MENLPPNLHETLVTSGVGTAGMKYKLSGFNLTTDISDPDEGQLFASLSERRLFPFITEDLSLLGLTIHGPRSYQFAQWLTTFAIMNKSSVSFFHLADIIDILTGSLTDPDFEDAYRTIASQKTLVVTGFFRKGPCPYPAQSMARLESFLFRRFRMESVTILESEAPLGKIEGASWFSPTFLSTIAEHSEPIAAA